MSEGNAARQFPLVETTAIYVILQTSSNRIKASIHLRERERIKDALNTSDDFIALTGVKVFDEMGLSLLYETPFMAINRNQLVWVIEDGGNLGVSKENNP